MMKVLYFGLDQLSANDSPIDLDFASIFEGSGASFTECLQESGTEDSNDIYYYEGHDYKSDKIALEKLAPDTLFPIGSESNTDLNHRLEQRRQRKREKKLAKWNELGYESKALNQSSLIPAQSYLTDQESDGCVSVIGDVTQPQTRLGESVAIISQ